MSILRDFYIDKKGRRKCLQEVFINNRCSEIIHFKDFAGNIFTEDIENGKYGLRNRSGQLVRRTDFKKFVRKFDLGNLKIDHGKLKFQLNPKKSKIFKMQKIVQRQFN